MARGKEVGGDGFRVACSELNLLLELDGERNGDPRRDKQPDRPEVGQRELEFRLGTDLPVPLVEGPVQPAHCRTGRRAFCRTADPPKQRFHLDELSLSSSSSSIATRRFETKRPP